ncbi:hypothetical protein FEM48_Zijuj05G0122800 [Ziziphus jujuba var. spinosa]|uniref:P-type ATPase A domain-containing protein n=1 Tax=Ziziphus jujuba var. spinosa TaxID=714518 RepID=A0A978VES2_ZIZJJ|nr:hypothetical protein FEM48_Zijuj05G0122800 [Ziziphus jujuba var. spinosa]
MSTSVLGKKEAWRCESVGRDKVEHEPQVLEAVLNETVDLESKLLKFLGFTWNPLSWVMKAASIMAIALANGGVLRDGRWNKQDAADLVPADIVSIKLVDIIPAHSRLLEGDPLKIDQSVLTGKSLLVTKGSGDGICSISTCKQGEIEAVVIANHCVFSCRVLEISAYGTITKQMAAIEEMTGMDMLCDDKADLTLNTLTVDKDFVKDSYKVLLLTGLDADTVVLMAARASRSENQDAIDTAIFGMLADGSLLDKDESIAALPIDELIEKAVNLLVFSLPGNICGMTGDGVNDAPALKKADIRIAVADAPWSASDIVLTEPGSSIIISSALTIRAIFQIMKSYTIHAVSITISIVYGYENAMPLHTKTAIQMYKAETYGYENAMPLHTKTAIQMYKAETVG